MSQKLARPNSYIIRHNSLVRFLIPLRARQLVAVQNPVLLHSVSIVDISTLRQPASSRCGQIFLRFPLAQQDTWEAKDRLHDADQHQNRFLGYNPNNSKNNTENQEQDQQQEQDRLSRRRSAACIQKSSRDVHVQVRVGRVVTPDFTLHHDVCVFIDVDRTDFATVEIQAVQHVHHEGSQTRLLRHGLFSREPVGREEFLLAVEPDGRHQVEDGRDWE